MTELLDKEPVLFRGCSLSELTFMSISAILVCVPGSLLVAALLGSVTMGFGVGGIAAVLTVIVGSSVYRRMKNNRPEGYFQLKVHFFLAKYGLVRTPFITRSGVWDLGRS